MAFGKYALIDAVTHNFAEEPDWFWIIKPVTSGMELEMSKFMAHNRMVRTLDGRVTEAPPTWMEIAYKEISLTFGGTNIKDDEGNPVLPDTATPEEVANVLREMPQVMVMEIWKAVGEAYPSWGPVDPNSV